MSDRQDGSAGSGGGPLEPLKKALTKAIDVAVVTRWEPAKARAASARGSTVEEQVADVRRAFARELATLGAATGAMAALPAVGTGIAVTSLVAELGWINVRMMDLMLTIAVLYGHGEASVEERRAWLIAMLLLGNGAVKSADRFASEAGKGFGKKATSWIPMRSLRAVNNFFGRTIITKNGTVRGVVAIGTAVPFGVGACIGAGGNYLTVGAMAHQANRFFSQLPWGGCEPSPAF